MTDPLSTLREAAGAMTAGEWRYRPYELDDWGYIRTAESLGFIVAMSRGPQSTKSGSEHRRDNTDPFEPNGRAIVLAVRLLRAVADPASVPECARVMLRLQEGPLMAERMEREETIQWRNRLRDATAILTFLASASAPESEG